MKDKDRKINTKELLDEHSFLSYCNDSNDGRSGTRGKMYKKVQPDLLRAAEKDGLIRPIFRSTEITEKFESFISELHFTDEELVELDARIGTDISILEEKRRKKLEINERKKKKIRDDLTYLRSNKISLLKSSVYTPESFLEEENKLNAQLSELHGQEQTSDEAMHETVKEVIKLSELIKNVVPYYRFANPREKERIIRIIFSELHVSQNTLDYKVKKGFEPFKSKSVAFCDPNGWLSELLGYRDYIAVSIKELEAVGTTLST
jgi:hypothetical protein|tara:strand:- start:147 stop:935 length:789 start_codon:yes stop_codon:yes gene_type:complete